MEPLRLDPLAPPPPPTQDELPYDDGVPMESPKHREQMNLLIESLRLHLGERDDVYVGGNMALYFNVLQSKANDFRAPDFFVVLDAIPGRERRSWVVWEEDRTPDVVVELLSESTEREDRGRKMQVYARLKVREYYLFDPDADTLEAFVRDDVRPVYHPVALAADGTAPCAGLGLRLAVREGTFQRRTTRWLRWIGPDGSVLPTGEELARAETARAEQEKARAEQEKARADRLAERLRAAGIEPE